MNQRAAIHQRLYRRLRNFLRAPQTPAAASKPQAILKATTDILGPYATTVANIGARWGDHKTWWSLVPLANIVGFEADPQECERLNSLSGSPRVEKYYPLALGDAPRTATFYFTPREPACSSIYRPDDKLADRFPQLEVLREYEERTVDLIPLDQWWAQEEFPEVAFLKIDTQGSELDILKGAEKMLQSTLGCEVEVEFTPLYRGQPLFADVDSFLQARGFRLWNLRNLCSYSEEPDKGGGRLAWGEAVYFRDYREVLLTEELGWRKLLLLACFLEAAGDIAAARRAFDRGLEALTSHETPRTPSALRLNLGHDPL